MFGHIVYLFSANLYSLFCTAHCRWQSEGFADHVLVGLGRFRRRELLAGSPPLSADCKYVSSLLPPFSFSSVYGVEQCFIKDFLGSFGTVAASKHVSRSSKDVIFIALLEHLVRHGNEGTGDYKQVLQAARGMCDAALMRRFGWAAGKGTEWDTWLGMNRGVASLVMDGGDILTVWQARKDLKTVVKPLQRLFTSGGLGAALFQGPRDSIASESLGVEFRRAVATVVEQGFSAASIDAMMRDTDDKIKTFSKQLVTSKREIDIKVLSMTGTTEVYSADYERELVLGMALRDAALNTIWGLGAVRAREALVQRVGQETKCAVQGP
jgi:hypothetical protein